MGLGPVETPLTRRSRRPMGRPQTAAETLDHVRPLLRKPLKLPTPRSEHPTIGRGGLSQIAIFLRSEGSESSSKPDRWFHFREFSMFCSALRVCISSSLRTRIERGDFNLNLRALKAVPSDSVARVSRALTDAVRTVRRAKCAVDAAPRGPRRLPEKKKKHRRCQAGPCPLQHNRAITEWAPWAG